MYNSHDLAISIKAVAREKNKVIKEMLKTCELSSNTMSSLYHGKSIAFDSVAKIADYLEVSVDYLLGRTDEPEIKPVNSIVNTNSNNNNSGTITNQTATCSKFDSRDLELLRKIKELGFDDFCEVANFINSKLK